MDPEDELHHWPGRLDISLDDDAGDGAQPQGGHVLRKAAGTFLKVIEDPKSQKMFAFVELLTGAVKSRQERDVAGVYVEWRVTGLGDDGGDSGVVSPEALRMAFEARD